MIVRKPKRSLMHRFRRAKRVFVVSPKPIQCGLVLTATVTLVFSVLLFMRVPGTFSAGPTKWIYLLNASPNEVGDTLAGFAGTMAFVWIIVTVFLQNHELRAQRQELRLTRIEFAEQRQATQEMARAMSAQASIFEDEKRVRSQNEYRELLNEYLHQIFVLVSSVDRELIWFEQAPEKSHFDEDTRFRLFGAFSVNEESETSMRALFTELDARVTLLVVKLSKDLFVKKPNKTEQFLQALHVLERIDIILEHLSVAQVTRLTTLKVAPLIGQFRALNNLSIAWSRHEETQE